MNIISKFVMVIKVYPMIEVPILISSWTLGHKMFFKTQQLKYKTVSYRKSLVKHKILK